MANEFAIDELLGYAVLTAPVTKIMTELPKPLPAPLYTQTNNVLGDRYRRITFRGTRRSSKRNRYGAPPTRRQRTGIQAEEMVMIHSLESVEIGTPNELQKIYRGYDNYEAQQGLIQEFDRQGADFAAMQRNLETTAIHSAIGYGKFAFDSNDEITLNFGGAAEVITLGIPAGNITAAGVDWSNPAVNIVGWLEGFLASAMRATGWPLRYAIMGRNISGYIANNTSFREYLKYTGAGEEYTRTRQVRPGVLGLDWITAASMTFEDSTGTMQEIFPPDQITFLPELTPDFYQLQKGSFLVPREFGFVEGSQFNAAMMGKRFEQMFEQVYGAFRYANGYIRPSIGLEVVQGNTFIPDFKRPEAIYLIDTTP